MGSTRTREVRVYSHEFRLRAVERILNGDHVKAVSAELGVHPKVLYQWVRRVKEGGKANLRGRGRPRKSDPPVLPSGAELIATLERAGARQQQEIAFLQQVLARLTADSSQARLLRDSVYAIMEAAQPQAGLSVEGMCQLTGVSRCGYYRYLQRRRDDGSAATA